MQNEINVWMQNEINVRNNQYGIPSFYNLSSAFFSFKSAKGLRNSPISAKDLSVTHVWQILALSSETRKSEQLHAA